MLNRILLVEDDPKLGRLIAEYLRAEGWEIEIAPNGVVGLQRTSETAFAALVLDIMLPGLSGLDVLRRLRGGSNVNAGAPIVMLTSCGDEMDRVLGLEMGADDCLPKPFSSRELAARLRAVLRRTGRAEARAPETPRLSLRVGDLEVDLAAQSATRAGVAVELTALEMRLLELLMSHAGTVVTREQIAREVLGRHLSLYDRSLDVHMSNLRRKLSPQDESGPIKTLRGTGYLFEIPEQT